MRGDWVSLLLATDEIIPRRADGFGMSVLSERATSLLAFLRSIPDSAACDACMAAHLGVDRYDVLKAIRELVLSDVHVSGVLGMFGAPAHRHLPNSS